MNIKTSILTGFLLSLLIGSPLLADDTEIFVGTDPANGYSNVLLSIDTSGSMLAHVINYDAVDSAASNSSVPEDIVNSHPKYDPNANYDATGGSGCRNDYYYDINLFAGGPIVPYVQRTSNSSNNTKYVEHRCRNDINYPDGYGHGIYSTSTRQRVKNAYSISSLDCPAARTALTNKGVFLDTNNLCAGYYDASYSANPPKPMFSGHFLDFIDTITDNNGVPIRVNTSNVDITGDDGSTIAPGQPLRDVNGGLVNAPWEDFFVESRLQIVKDVVNDIIANSEQYNINVGLMRFTNDGQGRGGIIDEPLINIGQPIGNQTPTTIANNKNTLRSKLNSFIDYSGTPLEETYHEGYLYYKGVYENYGEKGNADAFINGGYDNSGKRYKSPVTYACQKNSMILLTDGDPSSDSGVADKIRALYNPIYDPDSTCNGSGTCMDELSKYMYEQDLFPSDVGLIGPAGTVITSEENTDIKQVIQTHTIGFLNNNSILKNTADASDGISRFATNAADLKAVFAEALSQVIEEASSFTAPSLSVNNFNRLTNNDELYYSLFKPQREPMWLGNIKMYKLKDGKIVDQDGQIATGADGKFVNTSTSFWTDPATDDGDDVAKGGFASRLTVARNIYSNITGTSNLNVAANTVAFENANLTQAMLGATTANERTALIYWMNGLTTDNNTLVSTKTIGDTIHTNPTVLTYGASQSTDIDGNPVTSFDQTIYFGTNAGFLHAIDPSPASTGSMEEFAFIPRDLLPKVKTYAENKATSVFSKLYGLDGPISSWIEGDNGDGVIDASGETAHLYVTMRRGGKNIYAMDVTDRTNPKLDWQISGGTTAGFEELGQTWSKATPAVISYAGSKRNVLIFGGGYDPDQDSASVRTLDDQGRAIYIVDAKDGSLIWRAVPSTAGAAPSGEQLKLNDLKYSIPSDITVLDMNSDGLSDRLYVGDMGGQLWRFDLLATTGSQTSNITGGVIADLAADSSTADNRKFYYAPSVSRVSDDAFGSYLAVSLGSGKRANPKNTVINDKFYMIKDPFVFEPKFTGVDLTTPSYDYMNVSGSYEKIKDNNSGALVDITNIPNPSYDQIGTFGWLIDFTTTGEKVLSKALTADNKIFFTSYIPGSDSLNNSSCDASAAIGGGRLYAISLLTGSTTFKKNDTDDTDISDTEVDLDDTTHEDRFAPLNSAGIPPTPRLLITPNDNEEEEVGTVNANNCLSTTDATLIVSKESFVPPICTAPVRTYWQRYDTLPADL